VSNHFIDKREKEFARRTIRGVEYIFTEHRTDDNRCIMISAYSTQNGWSGGGVIVQIYRVDGGYVAMNPYNQRPLRCRQSRQELVNIIIDNFEGGSF
jgi:hypothetical protein